MRVIAGDAKGRTLKMVPGKGTRPITDKVKESLFNILSWRIAETIFLDLFAGTGSVGIEALSRGAEKAVFVEKANKAIHVIHENLRQTEMDPWATVLRTDAFSFLDHTQEQFDIVYVAPPQYKDMWSQALIALDDRPILRPGGVIVAQIFPKEFKTLSLQHFVLTDQRTYGSTMLCFYEYASEVPPPKSD